MRMHVVINGGGLAGALAAMYMLKFTPAVTVVEKRSDLRKATSETGRSINLVITSRGLFALRQLGLEESALKLCVPVEGRAIHSMDGAEVFQPYGVSKDEVNYSVSRTQLNSLLIEEAERRGARFFFLHELQSIDFDNMCATYKCPSGVLSMKADVFFGADGVGSHTRRAILEKLNSDGVKASDSMERLGISYKELTFPPRNGAYCMDSRGLHIWPRGAHFLMALADKNDSFTGTLYLPDGSAKLPVDATDVPTFEGLNQDPAKYEAYIRRVYPDVPNLVENYREQLSTRDHSFLATLRTTHWFYKGKACLFGDAAHGVVPFFGQGMNCAFESVVVLHRFLVAAGGLSRDSLEGTFQRYFDFHYSSAVAIADMAVENFAEMSYKVSLPEFIQRKQVENYIESKHPSLLRSRYFMVTKSLIPYATVRAAGPHIEACITAVMAACAAKQCTVAQLPDTDLLAIINAKVTPFFVQHKIDVGNPLKEYYPLAGGRSASNL